MALVEKITDARQARQWYGEIPVYHLYTLGVAGERFFREIKDRGRIMGARCNSCNLTYVPPKMYCERCFEELKEWVEAASRGTVYTYTIACLDMDGSRLEEPVTLAMIKLDGAHGGLVHRVGGIKPEEVRIGMPVQAVFKPKARRTGSILDIECFKPV